MKNVIYMMVVAIAFLFASCNSDTKPTKPSAKKAVKSEQKKGKAKKKAPAKKMTKLQKEISEIPNAPKGKTTLFSIDRINNQKGSKSLLQKPHKIGSEKKVVIVGRAVDALTKKAAKDVYIEINGEKLLPTNYGGASKEFARTSKNPNYGKARFQTSLDASIFKKGTNTIKLVIVGAGGKYKFQPKRTYQIIK